MITKFRDALEVRSSVESLREDVAKQVVSANQLATLLQNVTRETEKLQHQSNTFQNSFKKDMDAVANTQDAFRKELFEFKLFKGEMQKQLLEKVENEFDNLFNQHRRDLQKKQEQLTALQSNCEATVDNITKLATIPEKVANLNNTLKTIEIRLQSFTATIDKSSLEKAQLQRKVDYLERLIGKMKRHRPKP